MAKGGAGWRKAGGGWVGGADEDLLPGQLLLENLITGGYIPRASMSGNHRSAEDTLLIPIVLT